MVAGYVYVRLHTRIPLPFLSRENLVVVGLLVIGPALMVWAGRAKAKGKHAVVCAASSAALGAIGVAALASMQSGQGMFGVLLGLVAFGAFASTLALLSAAASIAIVLLSGSGRSNDGSIGKHDHVPLTQEYRRWKQGSHRPDASYQDFLNDAHPRHFPTSVVGWVIGALAMVLVVVLILRR